MSDQRASRQNPAVREFILRNVSSYPGSVTARACKEFGLSRTAVARYMRRLVADGLLTATGKTNGRRYELKPLVEDVFEIEISPGLPEDQIFRFRILPLIKGVNQNIVDICQYGFTEMLNNVIDHSESRVARIFYEQSYSNIFMLISDKGIGIFEKIQRDFKLADPRSALLELSKGKITSDKTRHSGEGIFFTSRMFDRFELRSGNLFYTRARQLEDDWLIETHDVAEYYQGTHVHMHISTNANWTPRQVFDQFQDDDILFRKTHVPIKLGRYPGEQLVSRSQAKRILARFDEFSEVLLDFSGVTSIGQPFADEIFRVFATEHPKTQLYAIHTSRSVQKMIDFVRGFGKPKS